jgi:catechol 2,3-dioxygenase-like lactoylglutathione lyase family enzyme
VAVLVWVAGETNRAKDRAWETCARGAIDKLGGNGTSVGRRKLEGAMIDRIDHIVMNCRDVETTASWYERALGFKREAYTSPAEPGERIALKFGRHKFNLRQTGSSGWVTCKVDAPGSLDLCFITDNSLKAVIARLNSLGIPITVGPAPRTGALGRMTSIYCEDPDGNLVEVATYAANPTG